MNDCATEQIKRQMIAAAEECKESREAIVIADATGRPGCDSHKNVVRVENANSTGIELILTYLIIQLQQSQEECIARKKTILELTKAGIPVVLGSGGVAAAVVWLLKFFGATQ